MSQVDFYLLENQTAQACFPFACRIIEKAYHLSHSVFVYLDSEENTRKFDDLLWIFADTSFIPHVTVSDQNDLKKDIPVLLSPQMHSNIGRDILINLHNQVSEEFLKFARIIEIIPDEEPARTSARQRFVFYKDQGCEIKTHKI